MLKKVIKLSSVETKSGEKDKRQWTMYKIKDQQGDKYLFFAVKKNGTKTKALETYDDLKLRIGDIVGVAFVEEQKEFKNDKGKMINFIQRTILYFAEVPLETALSEKAVEVSETVNSSTPTPKTPQKPISSQPEPPQRQEYNFDTSQYPETEVEDLN